MKMIQVLLVSFALLGAATAQAPAPVPLTTVETAFLVAANTRLQNLQTVSAKVQANLAQVTTQEQAAVKALTATPTTQLASQVQQLVGQMAQLNQQSKMVQTALASAQKELAADESKVLGLHSLPDGSTFAADFTTASAPAN